MIIPTNLLQDKTVILGVSGSIALYKSLELVRLFVKAGAQVKVIMSESAKKFVTPLTFETLSANVVLDDTNESWANKHNHIKIGEDADLFLVAPATANTMAKLANGIADNMLTQCALAFKGAKMLAPSANTNMLHNQITEQNMQTLHNAGYTIVATQTKELACKTTGDGAMAEPLEIFFRSARELLKDTFWTQRSVVISGGGTLEKIDDVRYISNFSSGKMASALAVAFYLKGSDVELVASRYEDDLAKNIRLHEVQSSKEMYENLFQRVKNATNNAKKRPFLFMAAAVSDYVPLQSRSGKLKKETQGEKFDLALEKNIDILKSLNKKDLHAIGFKAEMDAHSATQNATQMLQNKNLDAVCLNLLKDSSSFGTETNAIEFITKSQKVSLQSDIKLNIALQIAQEAKKLEETL